MSKSRLIVFLAGAAWLAGAACAAGAPNADSKTPVPSFTATDLDGQEWASASLTGKVAVINFWATWCPPCRAEIPDFAAFYDENKSKGLVILGFSVDRMPTETLREFVRKNNMSYPVMLVGNEIVQAFDPGDYIPTTFIIDKKGFIRHKQVGVLDKATLTDWFNRLSKE